MLYDFIHPLITVSRHLELKRGDYIYNAEDRPKNIYFIESGLVGLFHITEDGKETFLRVFGVGAILGHRSYYANTPYHANSMALAPTQLSVLSIQQWEGLIKLHPKIEKEILHQLAKDLGEAEFRLANLQDKAAHTRIVESMVYLKLKYPKQVWTRKEIAEHSGSTFETVARVITKLEQNQLIAKKGRDFIILDHQKLLNFSQNKI